MKHQIVSRYNTNHVLFECDIPDGLASGLAARHALEAAVESSANLHGADLRVANLHGADLRGADLLERIARRVQGPRVRCPRDERARTRIPRVRRVLRCPRGNLDRGCVMTAPACPMRDVRPLTSAEILRVYAQAMPSVAQRMADAHQHAQARRFA